MAGCSILWINFFIYRLENLYKIGMKTYTNLKKGEVKNSEVEFEAQIPLEVIETNSAKVLAKISADFEMPGFRKGGVPKDIVSQHVDKMHLFEEAANNALREAILEIATDEKLSIVGSPEITVTKIALDNPVEFKIKIALYPEITLPDYKKIGKEISERKEDESVSEQETAEAIERIQKMIALQKPQPEQPAEGEGEKKEAALPEITDEFVSQLGPFKNVEEFRAQIRLELGEEKKFKIRQARREEMVNEIVKQAKLSVPELFLNQELQNFVEHRNADLEQAGLTLENYLKEINKTAEEFGKEERATIEQHIKTQFILSEIRNKEGISAGHDEIHANEEFLKMRYPDKDHDYLHKMSEALIIQKKLFDVVEGESRFPKAEVKSEAAPEPAEISPEAIAEPGASENNK